jgi:6-pyruvoyl-tetrahydropterin synthase
VFSTGVTRPLRARHFLVGDFGDESVPHSHPYRVELICSSPGLDANGFSTDIAVMEEVLEAVLAEIDDVMLNELPFFQGRQSSLENLTLYLVAEIRARLARASAEPDEPIEIRIWENDSAWAGYRETR